MNNYALFCSLSRVLRAYVSKRAIMGQQIAANKPDKGQAELFRDVSIDISTWLPDQNLLREWDQMNLTSRVKSSEVSSSD